MILLRSRSLLGLQTAVLLTLFALSLLSVRHKTATFDEQSYITRGLAYLRGENRHMRVGHPLGLNALNALLLVDDETVRLPADDPSWSLPSFHRPSELFMWEIGNDATRIIWLGRVPTMWLLMLLVSAVARWTYELTQNRKAAVLAMALVAFDPNLLAHGRLATTDLGLALGALLAGWLLWRYWKRPSFKAIALAAVGFAILQNTKFTAGLFVPLFAFVILVGLIYQRNIVKSQTRRLSPSPFRPLLVQLALFPIVAFFVLWSMYGFQIGTMPDSLPTLPQLGGYTLPLAHHLEQLLDIGGRLTKSTPAYLLGHYSDSGWWYYFPVAFALKTPLPTLLLLVIAAGLTALRWVRGGATAESLFDSAALLLPSIGYFAFALTTDINLGYRHLLPVLPFFAVWIGREVAFSPFVAADLRFTISDLRFFLPALWLLGLSFWVFPHYLAFFNLFAGGADNGWRALVDSNLDWGQDLAQLSPWMEENGVERVWLSYFGEARPEYYGIDYAGLDSFPPRLMDPTRRPFNPTHPAPGIYAISATTLMGVHFDNHQQFAYFWDKTPFHKLGYSIFLYDVSPFGTPADLVLDNIQIDELTSVDLEALQTNQLDLHWLYDGSGRYYPASSSPTWVATTQPNDWLEDGQFSYYAENRTYTLLRLNGLPAFDRGESLRWTNGRSSMELTIVVEATAFQPGEPIRIETRLRHNGLDEPVRQFVHMTDSDGKIVAQWDGLDTAWQAWDASDLLVLYQTLPVPTDSPLAEYALWTGLYNPETGIRWQTESGEERWRLGADSVSDGKNCKLPITICHLLTIHSFTPSLLRSFTPSPCCRFTPSPRHGNAT